MVYFFIKFDSKLKKKPLHEGIIKNRKERKQQISNKMYKIYETCLVHTGCPSQSLKPQMIPEDIMIISAPMLLCDALR